MSLCKQGCGLEIQWVQDGKKPDGAIRWKCVNADGSDHWDACAKARNARVRAEGVPFTDPKGEGFIFEGKKKYFHMVATTNFGKKVRR